MSVRVVAKSYAGYALVRIKRAANLNVRDYVYSCRSRLEQLTLLFAPGLRCFAFQKVVILLFPAFYFAGQKKFRLETCQ